MSKAMLSINSPELWEQLKKLFDLPMDWIAGRRPLPGGEHLVRIATESVCHEGSDEAVTKHYKLMEIADND